MAVRLTKAHARKAGLLPGRVRKPPEVAVAVPLWWAVEFNLPCRVVSEANRREHWAVAKRRADTQKDAVAALWVLIPNTYTTDLSDWVVTLTHVGPKMDGDNLQRGFKAIRDGLAVMIGVDDGDSRIEWRYAQQPGPPGVEVRIESGRDTPRPSPSASTVARGRSVRNP